MDIRAIRHHNLTRLVREAGGQKRLAERAGVSAAYVSQVLSCKVNRNVGHSMARRLESGMNKPYGWMDVLPEADAGAGMLREVDAIAGGYGRARRDGRRRERVLALARQAGGTEALARRAGVHPAYLDRVLEGALPAAPADLARRLERAAGRPAGWLDRDCGPEGEGTASG